MLVYEMMSKIFPFDGLMDVQIQYKIIYNKRPELNRDIPQIFKNLIKKCWHEDPSKRPSFKEIVEQLKTNQEYLQNVDKNLFNSYVEFVEKRSINIQNNEFKQYSLKSIKKEIESIKYLSSVEGIIDINGFEEEDIIEEIDSFEFYEILDKKTGSKYTAKVSKYIEKFNPKEIKGISNEIQILLKLDHPTIEKFIGFSFIDFKSQKRPVIINENLDRLTLFNLLEDERKGKSNNLWNSTKKLIVIYGIAYGMNLLHSNNIFHPNLNTKNVFIDKNSFQPKLNEIGSFIQLQNTKNAASRSSLNLNFSKFYFAPEMLESNEQTFKSDVYSFSIVAYEIMTSEVPFKEINRPDLIYSKIINKNYRPKFHKEIPGIYKKLIENCWLHDPSKRPSFSEIIDQLEHDKNYITEDVNENEFYNYVTYLNQFNNI